MAKKPRVPRDISSLLVSLRTHQRLLKDYSVKAFNEGDASFLGEVAGKLRVLVYRGGTNKPLLLDLINHYQFEIKIPMSDITGDYQVTPNEYLERLAYAIRTPTRGLVQVTNHELIGLWAQQHGASHEDWEIDEELASAFALSRQLSIGGYPAIVRQLRAISNTVIWVCDQFLQHIDAINITS